MDVRPLGGAAVRGRAVKRYRLLATVATAALAALGAGYFGMPAFAQLADIGGMAQPTDPDAQMILQADELVYDYDDDVVTARGNVEIYYDNRALEADRVVYDRRTQRVQAEGNVRIVEPDGNIIYTERADVTEDLADGFADALRVDSVDRTRFAAVAAERLPGDVTVFRRGVYTACEPCAENPERPPQWQVRAARIIYDREERVVYYRDATLEMFGLPIAYLPYFAHPDPEKGRRSGFLTPSAGFTDNLGFGLTVPYYFALADHYDLTVTPTIYSQQGLLLEGEFRHRTLNGSYDIRPSGIFQLDPGAFSGLPGDRQFRGAIQTRGDFEINDRWNWGWDITAQTDRTFLTNYGMLSGVDELKSDLFLTGESERNYFDARLIHFQSLVGDVRQAQLPTVHPLVDYNYVLDQPVFGGQASFDMNFLSLSRSATDSYTFADDDDVIQRAFRGLDGNINRFSIDAEWRRMLVGPAGQLFTPFVAARSDIYWFDVANDPFDPVQERPLDYPVGFDPGDNFVWRGMPTVGMDYRWPFMSGHSWGTQTVSPIAQIVARPDEPSIGRLPNEDAQSLVFDDTTLFERDKFSGFDRVEGGVRANVGLSYTLALDSGPSAHLLFGQSFHLAGRNSFDVPDLLHTGTDSGLDQDRSDYVGRFIVEPVENLSLATRFRLNKDTLDTERLEVGVRGQRGPVTASLTYASLNEQPNLGLDSREAVASTLGLRIGEFWNLNAGGFYDLGEREFRGASLGLAYEDECLLVSLSYTGDFTQSIGSGVPDHRVTLNIQLRTLGGAAFTQGLDDGFLGSDSTMAPNGINGIGMP